MQNIKDTIMSQYAHSPVILALIENIDGAIDPKHTIDDLYDLAMKISDAKGVWLDLWGVKVGIGRNVKMDDPNGDYFGFNVDGFEPFDQAPFASGGSGLSTYDLPDDDYRQLILMKAALNILYVTAPNINKYIKSLFNGNRAYYRITGNMQAEYVFNFELTLLQRLFVFKMNLLPIPSGVAIKYSQIIAEGILGFEDGFQPLNFGVLAP